MAKKNETKKKKEKLYSLPELVNKSKLPRSLVMMRLSCKDLVEVYKEDSKKQVPVKRLTQAEFDKIVGE